LEPSPVRGGGGEVSIDEALDVDLDFGVSGAGISRFLTCFVASDILPVMAFVAGINGASFVGSKGASLLHI
jgi:hypothetical protein